MNYIMEKIEKKGMEHKLRFAKLAPKGEKEDIFIENNI